MRKTARILRPCLGAVTLWLFLYGGFDLRAATPPQPALVGELGRPAALVCEGNRTFSKETLLDALQAHLDYHIAAHPAAPLAEYTALLERKLLLGYRRAGFPEASVRVGAEPAARRLVLRVEEGPRYRCGDLRLTGWSTMTNENVRRHVLEAIAGNQPPAAQDGKTNTPLWLRGEPAPFDEYARARLIALAREGLAGLNYYEPNLALTVVPNPATGVAELCLRIADEGIKGTVAEIVLEGPRKNTRAQVLSYLHLQPGQALHAQLATTLSNQLWNSARFLRHEVELTPLTNAGQFKLHLTLDELDDAPLLDQPFSPSEQALLKFRDWIVAWEARAEDLAFSLNVTSAWLTVSADWVMSPAGLALVLRTPVSNAPPRLCSAVLVRTNESGFYSSWRQRKLVAAGTPMQLGAFVNCLPLHDPTQKAHFNLTFGGSFKMAETPEPFRPDFQLAPVAFLSLAHGTNVQYALADGLLTLTYADPDFAAPLVLKLETATGRLRELTAHFRSPKEGALSLRVRSERGYFARLGREIAAATSAHTNDYVAAHGLASFLSFLAGDFLDFSAMEPLVRRYLEASVPAAQQARAMASLTAYQSTLTQARALVQPRDLERLFSPFERLQGAFHTADNGFTVPWEDALAHQGAGGLFGFLGALALRASDLLLPPGSWPWTLVRETTFSLTGQSKYAQAELEKLRRSDQLGPLGCLTTAFLVGKLDPTFGRAFAQLGLARLTPAEARKDYDILFQSGTVAGDFAANLLGLLRDLTPAQVVALTAGLPTNQAALVRQAAQLLRANPTQRPSVAVWPACEQHWDLVLRGPLEGALRQFLPQVQFLTDPKALFERGHRLITGREVLRDYQEAAQCFRKAAEQGHAGAQLQLALLCQEGKGLAADPAEALRWLRKAAAQKEPHAACHLADFFRDGRGVRRDLEEAAKWYRAETETNCPRAHLSLGRLCEAQGHLPEAIQWYRRAAEGGETTAQAHLGDLLSDGITTAPDYLEACQWLILAAEQDENNKLIQLRLRRARAQLTPAQEEQARDRAAAVTKRLNKL